jgi:hypothetical protein
MKRNVIFAAAHAVTRAVRAEFADADYRATFAAALRECYAAAALAESISADAIAAAVMSARAAWESMSGEAQYNALVAMVWHMKKRDNAACDKRGNERAPRMTWIESADDARACAHEAYCRMDALLTRNAEREDGEKPLALVMAKAVMRAAQYIDRAEKRHASALRIESITDEDGNTTTREYIKDSESIAERIAPSPFEYAALADTINAVCADDIDRQIMRARIYGLTQTEIAELVGMSQRGVSKRIERMTARYIADTLNNA